MLDQTRRGFLFTVMSAAAAGTLLSNAALAAATEGLNDRYSTVIRLGREIVQYNESFRDSLTVAQRAEFCSRKGNEMLSYMLEHFARDVVPSKEEIAPLFRPGFVKSRDLLTESDLTDLTEIQVPVAVMRELIQKHRIPFRASTELMPAFDTFASKYKDAILG